MPYYGTNVSVITPIGKRKLEITVKIHGPLGATPTFVRLEEFIKAKINEIAMDFTLMLFAEHIANSIKHNILDGENTIWVDVCVSDGKAFYGAIAEKILLPTGG